MTARAKVEKIRERAMCEAYDIACKPCQLTPCDVDMLYKLMDIAKDTYEASKYAMEVADLATHAAASRCEMNPYVGMMMEEHHDHDAAAAKA